MPVPSAVISVPICSDDSILSARTRSTLSILPRSGRIAWNARLRPCLALPPAESPSTMKSSLLAGSFSWQSASLPGSEETLSGFLRVSSRALRAAFSGGRSLDHLADDDLGFARMLLEPGLQRLVDDVLNDGADFRGDQLVLGLRRKLRVRHLHREDRSQALAAIVAGELDLFLFRVGVGIAAA